MRLAAALRLLAIAAYAVALVLPPFSTRAPSMQELGVTILFFGWVSLFGPHPLHAWLANPLVIFCFVHMRKNPASSTVAALLALVAAYDFYQVRTFGWDSARDEYWGEVTGINAGAYLWLLSLATALAASIAHLATSRRCAKIGT